MPVVGMEGDLGRQILILWDGREFHQLEPAHDPRHRVAVGDEVIGLASHWDRSLEPQLKTAVAGLQPALVVCGVAGAHRQVKDSGEGVAEGGRPSTKMEVRVGQQVGIDHRDLPACETDAGIEVIEIGHLDAIEDPLQTYGAIATDDDVIAAVVSGHYTGKASDHTCRVTE